MNRGLVLVEMLDELGDSAFVVELVRLFRLLALVFDGDADAFVQKCLFAQALGQFVEAEFDQIEDLRIRFEGDLRAASSRLAGVLQASHGDAAHIFLLVGFAVSPDLHMQRLGKKVHHGNADTVQAAGNFVGISVELAAGVQFGQDDFGRGFSFLLDFVNRNAAPVVDHGDRVVEVNSYFDCVTVSGQRFVDGVVDYFIDQVMQPHIAGGADVHRRSFANRFATFKDANRRRIVRRVLLVRYCPSWCCQHISFWYFEASFPIV